MKLNEINSDYLKTISDKDLLELHGLLHEIYDKSVQKALGISNAGGALNKPEIGEIEIKIKDIDEYEPKEIIDEQLVDDWKIINDWYFTIKEDKKEFKFTKEQVVKLAKKIYKEMIKREFVFKPEDYKEWNKELFEAVSKND